MVPKTLARISFFFCASFIAQPFFAASFLGPEPFDTVPPAGWIQVDVAMEGFLWEANGTRPSPDSGGNAAFYDDFNSTIPNDVWLISPSMNLSGVTAPELDYQENVNFAGYADTHEVLMSSDYAGSGDPNLATWTTLNAAIGAEDTWVAQNFDISAFAGQGSVYLAFRYVGDFAAEWWIDDVHVSEPDPFAVTVSAAADSNQGLGEVVDYTFRVTNSGTNTDTFDLVGSGTFFTSLSTTTTAALMPGEFEDVMVSADVPCGATVGMAEALELTATSQGDNMVMGTDSAQITPSSTNSGSGGGGYFFANSLAACAPSMPNFAWIDISGTGTNVQGSLADDNFIGPFPIGFTFPFFGNDFTEFYIASNGWISFDGTDPGGALNRNNTAMPNAAEPNNMIAGFWDDMNPTDPDPGGSAVYHGLGPGGELVVTFERLPEFGAIADGWITFQIVLYPDGNIRIQNMDHGPSIDLAGATVGIENADGTLGLEYHLNGTGGVLFSSPLAIEFGSDENDLPVDLQSFSID